MEPTFCYFPLWFLSRLRCLRDTEEERSQFLLPLLLPFNLGGRRSHQIVAVHLLSAWQQRPFTGRYLRSPSGQTFLLSLNISYSQIGRILLWKTKRDVEETRGAQESLERHTSDCFKFIMKLKLFIMNTGEQLLGRLNYKQIPGEFQRRSCEGQFRASDQPRGSIPPRTSRFMWRGHVRK